MPYEKLYRLYLSSMECNWIKLRKGFHTSDLDKYQFQNILFKALMTCPKGTANVVSSRTLQRETKCSVSCGASQLMGYSSTANKFPVLSIDTSLLILYMYIWLHTKGGVL